VRDGGVSSARLERAMSASSTLCLCHWATRTWSLRPGSNRLPASYEDAALPSELRRHWLGYQASNLESSRSRAGRVCQFPYIPSVRAAGVEPARALAHQGLSLARLPVTPRPRAPPGPRTRNPLIKSQLHVHLCLQRESRDEWARTSVLRAPSAALQPN
jgi:hypothetical protein